MLKKLLKITGSLKLALYILIALTIVSLIGIIIPQNLNQMFYISKYGNTMGRLIINLRIDHTFTSLWFYYLMGLLCVNILVCSGIRFYRKLKALRMPVFLNSKETLTKPPYSYHTIEVNQANTNIPEQITRYFKSRFWQVKTKDDKNNPQIYAQKGILKEIGSFLFHIGLVILLAGGLFSRNNGYVVYRNMKDGDVIRIPEKPNLLRCESFRIERNKKGAIKDYKSRLSLLDPDSSVIISKTIEVNAPLSYDDIKIFQSSYGEDIKNLKKVKLRIRWNDKDTIGVFPFNKTVGIFESGLELMILRYVPNFVVNVKTGKVSSRSGAPDNPAVKVLITQQNDTLYNHWTFLKYRNTHHQTTNISVNLIQYQPEYFTGLQIRKNAAIPIIWAGIFLMATGIFMLFLVQKKRLWIFTNTDNSDKTVIHTGLLMNSTILNKNELLIKLSESLKSDLTK